MSKNLEFIFSKLKLSKDIIKHIELFVKDIDDIIISNDIYNFETIFYKIENNDNFMDFLMISIEYEAIDVFKYFIEKIKNKIKEFYNEINKILLNIFPQHNLDNINRAVEMFIIPENRQIDCYMRSDIVDDMIHVDGAIYAYEGIHVSYNSNVIGLILKIFNFINIDFKFDLLKEIIGIHKHMMFTIICEIFTSKRAFERILLDFNYTCQYLDDPYNKNRKITTNILIYDLQMHNIIKNYNIKNFFDIVFNHMTKKYTYHITGYNEAEFFSSTLKHPYFIHYADLNAKIDVYDIHNKYSEPKIINITLEEFYKKLIKIYINIIDTKTLLSYTKNLAVLYNTNIQFFNEFDLLFNKKLINKISDNLQESHRVKFLKLYEKKIEENELKNIENKEIKFVNNNMTLKK